MAKRMMLAEAENEITRLRAEGSEKLLAACKKTLEKLTEDGRDYIARVWDAREILESAIAKHKEG